MKKYLLVLFFLFYSVSASFATGTVLYTFDSTCVPYAGRDCLERHRWYFTESGGVAVDQSESTVITGRIVGVEFVEISIAAATTVELIDNATGRDILQGLFTAAGSGEASATATAASHWRNAVDSTQGGWITEYKKTAYISISSGSGTDSGYVDVLVEPMDLKKNY